VLEIRIGLKNFNGAACGILFKSSVAQNIPPEWEKTHPQVKRLLLLFPGTKVAEVEEQEKKSESLPPGSDDAEKAAELAAAVAADEEAARKAAEEEADSDAGEETGEEEEEERPLAAGDPVMALYKEEVRRGEVVKVLESGVVHVKLEDDTANYRVLDDDKVTLIEDE
jgi:hypothetical protein